MRGAVHTAASPAEHSVLQPSLVLLGSPDSSSARTPPHSLPGHREEARGGRIPMRETTVGTAEWPPGTLQAVGGSGHTKASYSLEHRLLLLLKQKLQHLGGLQGSVNHSGTRVRPRAARSHESRAGVPGC